MALDGVHRGLPRVMPVPLVTILTAAAAAGNTLAGH
jgi:hypothetical protein